MSKTIPKISLLIIEVYGKSQTHPKHRTLNAQTKWTPVTTKSFSEGHMWQFDYVSPNSIGRSKDQQLPQNDVILHQIISKKLISSTTIPNLELLKSKTIGEHSTSNLHWFDQISSESIRFLLMNSHPGDESAYEIKGNLQKMFSFI